MIADLCSAVITVHRTVSAGKRLPIRLISSRCLFLLIQCVKESRMWKVRILLQSRWQKVFVSQCAAAFHPLHDRLTSLCASSFICISINYFESPFTSSFFSFPELMFQALACANVPWPLDRHHHHDEANSCWYCQKRFHFDLVIPLTVHKLTLLT